MFQPLERGRSFRSKQIQFWLNNQVRLILFRPAQTFLEVHHDIFKGPYIMTSLQVSPDVSLREKVEFFWNQFDTELAFYTRVAMLRNVNITKDHEIHIIRVWSKEKLYRHYIRQAYSKIQEFFFFWGRNSWEMRITSKKINWVSFLFLIRQLCTECTASAPYISCYLNSWLFTKCMSVFPPKTEFHQP